MRKKGMIWFTFVLLLASLIPNLMQAYIVYAQSPEEVSETIIQKEHLKVSTIVKQVENQMSWEIKYQMTVPNENTAQRLKFKIYNNEGKAEANTDANLVQPDKIEGWGYSEDNWFMPEAFTTSAEGSIFVKTALSVKQLHLNVQLDEEVTTEVAVVQSDATTETTQTTDTTGTIEATPVTEGEVTQEVIVTENILEAPHSDSHQLSAPKVNETVTSQSEESTQETVTQPSETTTEVESGSLSTETSQIESSPSETSSISEGKLEKTNPQEGVVPIFGPMITPFSTNLYVDGFDYTTNPAGTNPVGTFPTHWTNRYLPDVNTSEDVRNFNYLKTVIGRTATPANYNAGQRSPANEVVNIKNSGSLAAVLDADGAVRDNPNIPALTNFGDGYIGYWQPNDVKNLSSDLEKFSKLILNKKTVKATIDPTKFEIELDVIGGVTVKPDRLIDISFVIDRSSSMTGNKVPESDDKTRWEVLKTAMTKFTDDLLTDDNKAGDNGKGYIRMGLAAFGSKRTKESDSDKPKWAYGEIGNFGTGIAFTNQKSDVMSHYLINTNPETNSGTPTYLGLDAGLKLLNDSARSNAQKVLIILTDGVPTFGPGSGYTNITTGSTVTNPTAKVTRYAFLNDTNKVYGSGSESQGTTAMSNIRASTIAHANSRPQQTPSVVRYSIGFGVSGVGDVLTALATTDTGGLVGEANTEGGLDDILAAFADAIGPKTPYIRNATINDPMSPYVTLDQSSVTVEPLTLNLASGGNTLTVPGTSPPHITNIVKKVSDNGVILEKVTLSGTADANRVNNVKYGLRLKYKVTLNTNARDGTFYQTNGPTFLDQSTYDYSLGFTVPSVRYKEDKRKETVKVPVRKNWQREDETSDTGNHWGTQKPVTFQLQKTTDDPSSTTPAPTWVNVAGKTITLPVGTVTGEFSGLPTTTMVGTVKKTVFYRVIETRVLGYEAPTFNPTHVGIIDKNDESETTAELKVTNKLMVTNITFKKTKDDGKTELPGVTFTIRKKGTATPILQTKTSLSNGNVQFTGLPIGEYTIEEVTPPDNYKPIAPIEVKVTDTGSLTGNGVLTVTGLPANNIVKNHLKDIDLVIKKQDNHGNALDGAVFTLTRTIPAPPGTPVIKGPGGNVFTFTGLTPGTYTLEETSAPNGYIPISPITIVVAVDGTVTVTGNDSEIDKTDPNKNLIKLTIKNRQKGQLPSTGGNGAQQYLIATLILASIAGVVGVYYVYRNRKGAE